MNHTVSSIYNMTSHVWNQENVFHDQEENIQ